MVSELVPMGAVSKLGGSLFTGAGFHYNPRGPAVSSGELPLPGPETGGDAALPRDAPRWLKSRKCRSALQRRRAREAVVSLNKVCSGRSADLRNSGSLRDPGASSSSNAFPAVITAAGEALSYIWKSHADNRPPKEVAQGAEALAELLKARDLYPLEVVGI